MTMRRAMAVLCVGLTSAVMGCSTGPQEIGGVLGSPTGVSYATTLETGDRIVVQGGLSLISGAGYPITVDWILGEGSAHDVIATGWSYYWGVGVRAKFMSDNALDDEFGVRVPAGLIKNSEPAFEGLFFVEAAPGWDLAGPQFTLDFAMGMRWPF